MMLPGVGNPLSADHELILDAFAKTVAGAASMISSNTDTILDGGGKILDLFFSILDMVTIGTTRLRS